MHGLVACHLVLPDNLQASQTQFFEMASSSNHSRCLLALSLWFSYSHLHDSCTCLIEDKPPRLLSFPFSVADINRLTHACVLVYRTSWWHIEQRSLRPGNAWETITLFERSHVRVISSRRYPGHWWKIRLRLSSFGDDLMWRSRELVDDDNIRDRFRRSSKHRPIDFKLWFVAPRSSSHHTSRRGFRLGSGFSFEFERFYVASLSERFKELTSFSRVAAGNPSLSYK